MYGCHFAAWFLKVFLLNTNDPAAAYRQEILIFFEKPTI